MNEKSEYYKNAYIRLYKKYQHQKKIIDRLSRKIQKKNNEIKILELYNELQSLLK